MGQVIPFPISRILHPPAIELEREAAVEFLAACQIEQHGAGAADEARRLRNGAWRVRDFRAVDRWSAVHDLVARASLA